MCACACGVWCVVCVCVCVRVRVWPHARVCACSLVHWIAHQFRGAMFVYLSSNISIILYFWYFLLLFLMLCLRPRRSSLYIQCVLCCPVLSRPICQTRFTLWLLFCFPVKTLLKFVLFFTICYLCKSLFPVSVLSGALNSSCRLFIPSLHCVFSIGVKCIKPCFYLVRTLFMCMILFFFTIISDKRTAVGIGSRIWGMFSVFCWILLLFVPFRSFFVSMTLVHMWSCVWLSFSQNPIWLSVFIHFSISCFYQHFNSRVYLVVYHVT